ncbi:hypothetical protein ACQ4M4_21015 [Leptolyngbya sp. AN02str]|uniref:hypothetical protein n=1 Tax=Leptolyngbya sp. AN02str TaxID=3423363 RepID=UPI003D31338C
MAPLDVVIVMVYLFTLIYVGYRAYNNLEDQAAVIFDQASLKAQLQEQGLQNAIAIRIPFRPRYQFETIPDLSLTVVNSSPYAMYVDWDRCSLTNFSGRSRRVVRITPTMNLDLSRPQIFSVIAPGKMLTERVVAEDMLRRNADGTLQVAAPLVDLSPARSLPEEAQLEFAFRLVFRVADTNQALDEETDMYAVLCRFIVKRVPWDAGYPWKQKKESS